MSSCPLSPPKQQMAGEEQHSSAQIIMQEQEETATTLNPIIPPSAEESNTHEVGGQLLFSSTASSATGSLSSTTNTTSQQHRHTPKRYLTASSDDATSTSGAPSPPPPASLSLSRQTSVSVQELQELCFPVDLDLVEAFRNHPSSEFSVDQNSTVASAVPSNSQSNDERSFKDARHFSSDDLHAISLDARPGLMEITVSRTGRELQRCEHVFDSSETTPGTTTNAPNDITDTSGVGPNCRLTTGCVPILQDGRILLITSSKSTSVFVLPKGGWEQDESMPLSALRETLEEAGVTGILGPPLPALTYETKKAARLRRSQHGHPHHNNNKEEEPSSVPNGSTTVASSNEPPEDGSTTSHPHTHTHNRMTLFPMYVQQVYENWPEQQLRRRKAVTMEEALDMVRHRPEFLQILEIVQERQLHQLGTQSSSSS